MSWLNIVVSMETCMSYSIGASWGFFLCEGSDKNLTIIAGPDTLDINNSTCTFVLTYSDENYSFQEKLV